LACRCLNWERKESARVVFWDDDGGGKMIPEPLIREMSTSLKETQFLIEESRALLRGFRETLRQVSLQIAVSKEAIARSRRNLA